MTRAQARTYANQAIFPVLAPFPIEPKILEIAGRRARFLLVLLNRPASSRERLPLVLT